MARVRIEDSPRFCRALALAAALVAPAVVTAEDDAAGGPHVGDLDLSLDLGALIRGDVAGAVASKPESRGAASSLPDPRALRGVGAASEDATVRLNVKGFSLLQMDEAQGARLQLRRVREREWRRPALSVTLEKKF